MIKFGPAGNSEDFYDEGYRSSLDMPKWLSGKGIYAYEYQCGKGVRISYDSAKILGNKAKENGISLSIHAPYYISLSSVEEEKREKSIYYILETLNIAKKMGAKRIVVHSGSCGSITRAEALSLASDTLKKALRAADENGFSDIHICPETMGKINQLGSVEEVIKLCMIDERLIPTFDFGHINARTLGGLKSVDDVLEIFKRTEAKLGRWRTENFHSHYSRIEFTNQGEKKHHTFLDTEYGPEFDIIAEAIVKMKLTPTVICESRGTQTRDALLLKKIYEEKRKNYECV